MMTPYTDIFHNDHETLLLVELPGMPKDRIGLNIDKDTLVIEATPPEAPTATEDDHEVKTLKQEFILSPMTRSFTIPDDVDRDAIHAQHKDGVLWVHLPKKATSTSRRIDIH